MGIVRTVRTLCHRLNLLVNAAFVDTRLLSITIPGKARTIEERTRQCCNVLFRLRGARSLWHWTSAVADVVVVAYSYRDAMDVLVTEIRHEGGNALGEISDISAHNEVTAV